MRSAARSRSRLPSILRQARSTLTQYLAVVHGTPGISHDEVSSSLTAGVLNLNVTVTDGDDDVAPRVSISARRLRSRTTARP